MYKQVLAISMMFSVFGLSGMAIAEESKKAEPKNPEGEEQPWSEYRVHDMKRPHPVKVKTEGAVVVKAPADAVVIFDGRNTDALTDTRPNAKTELKPWVVQDGVLIASPGNTSTKQSFGSMQLHLEWKIPAGRKVQGQKGGNSGVFLMGVYEIQIQESHTNVTYADGQAASLYGQTPPKVNASAPQGEWQSYDIVFEAPVYGEKGMEKPAYVTVIHNGVMVHHRQKFYGPTKHKKATSYPVKHPEKAPIKFQWHKDPIEFRNIWVREL
jgi:hypothetical protein